MPTIILIRHGESVWNSKNLIQGHANAPDNKLTLQGIEDMHVTAAKLQKLFLPVSQIFYSPDIRSEESARILKRYFPVPLAAEKRLKDKYQGEQEGRDFNEFKARYEAWLTLPEEEKHTFRFAKEGENGQEVAIRCLNFIESLPQDGVYLCITHSGLTRSLLVHMGFTTYQRLEGFDNGGYCLLTTPPLRVEDLYKAREKI